MSHPKQEEAEEEEELTSDLGLDRVQDTGGLGSMCSLGYFYPDQSKKRLGLVWPAHPILWCLATKSTDLKAGLYLPSVGLPEAGHFQISL